MSKRINRSKYNFSTLQMGGTFVVKPLDLISMKNSLRYYNKEHNQNVVVSAVEQADGDVLITRVPAKIKKV